MANDVQPRITITLDQAETFLYFIGDDFPEYTSTYKHITDLKEQIAVATKEKEQIALATREKDTIVLSVEEAKQISKFFDMVYCCCDIKLTEDEKRLWQTIDKRIADKG